MNGTSFAYDAYPLEEDSDQDNSDRLVVSYYLVSDNVGNAQQFFGRCADVGNQFVIYLGMNYKC